MLDYPYSCCECEYCTMGERFVRQPAIRKADGQLIIETTKQYTRAAFCTKDINFVREIHEYDDVCDEHGDLTCEANMFPEEYERERKEFERRMV